MKKVIAVLLTFFMICDLTHVGMKARQENEEIEIIETQELRTLTKEDYEKLYTLKDDVRKTDDRIVELSQSDAWLLMQVARSEGGKTLRGQLWVMGVIVNRMNSEDFPDTLYEVVTQENPIQFEVYKTGKYKEAELEPSSHLALSMIEKGINPTNGAIWFEATSNSDHSWHKQKEFVAEVEGNLYYK